MLKIQCYPESCLCTCNNLLGGTTIGFFCAQVAPLTRTFMQISVLLALAVPTKLKERFHLEQDDCDKHDMFVLRFCRLCNSLFCLRHILHCLFLVETTKQNTFFRNQKSSSMIVLENLVF